jgi:hypothetical protein
VKFNLRLSRDTNIEKVRKTVKQLGQEMMKDPELGKELLQPLNPTWVQRESLKRIYKVFGEKGIEFASGAITVQTAGGRGKCRRGEGYSVTRRIGRAEITCPTCQGRGSFACAALTLPRRSSSSSDIGAVLRVAVDTLEDRVSIDAAR